MSDERVMVGLPRTFCERGELPRACIVTGEQANVTWHTVEVLPNRLHPGVDPLVVDLPFAEGAFEPWVKGLLRLERFIIVFAFTLIGWLLRVSEIATGACFVLTMPTILIVAFFGERRAKRGAPSMGVDGIRLWLSASPSFARAFEAHMKARFEVMKRIAAGTISTASVERPSCRAHARPTVEVCSRCGDFICEECILASVLCSACRERPRRAELRFPSTVAPLAPLTLLALVPGNVIVQATSVIMGTRELFRSERLEGPRRLGLAWVAIVTGALGAVVSIYIALRGWSGFVA